MFHDLSVVLQDISELIDGEVECLKSYFCGKAYDGRLFMNPVSISGSIEKENLSVVPKGNGIYVFEIIKGFNKTEYERFKIVDRGIKATKLRENIRQANLGKGNILYIGSCKTMGIRERLKEHLFDAGNGVYSLRPSGENRWIVKKKLKITCFEMNDFGNQDYAKILLPCIEEKLQRELHPAAGRYRG